MWERMYEEFWDKLEHFCAKLCHDESRAEDLTQEVFLKALQNRTLIDSFTSRQCKAWLFATARNLYCDQVRRSVREQELLEELLPDEEEPMDETASAAVGQTDLTGLLELLEPLDRSFLLRAQPRLYWAERVFVATDPKLDAAALAATGAHFAGQKAILTERNAAVLVPLFSDDTELVVLPDGTTVLDDDLELNTAALRRCGTRLYVMGDMTVAEGTEEGLKKLEYLHVDGDVVLPAALEETFCAIPELEYRELKLLKGHAIVDAPKLRLGRELLELYPEGITCVDCAAVRLDEDLEPDTIIRNVCFDGCAMVCCTAQQENAVHAVSRDVARVQTGDDKEETADPDTVQMNGVRISL